MWKKILISIAILFIGAAAFFTFTKIPTPFPADSLSASWSKNGNYEVAKMDFVLRDETRKTQAHPLFNEFKGHPYRQFETTVWFPKQMSDGSHPLIIYSHGFMSDRRDLEYITQNLASRGYIVLAANYPLTSNTAGKGVLMYDVVNQPDDVSFFINQVNNSETEIGKNLARFVNKNKIGVMGYSLGGLTSALVGYHPTKKDSRIKAVASFAGPSAMLGKTFYQNNDIPFMTVAGTIDSIVPYPDHAGVILDRVDNSVLVSIERGTHMGFVGLSKYLRWLDNPDGFACGLMNKKMESLGMKRGAAEKAWYPLLGTVEQGIILNDSSMACPPDVTPPSALNPLQQQMIAKVAAVSFFESIFNDSASERELAKQFLLNNLQKENSIVKVAGTYTAKSEVERPLIDIN